MRDPIVDLVQESIYKDTLSRSTKRKAMAIILAMIWITIALVQLPLSPIWELLIVPTALIATFGAQAITNLLNENSPLYNEAFAKRVYGGLVSELDRCGGCVDLDYVYSNPVCRTALGLRGVRLTKGLTYRGEPVAEILPMVVRGAAVPYEGVVYVRTPHCTHKLGPRYFLENLDGFQAIAEPELKLSDYLVEPNTVDKINAAITDALLDVYFSTKQSLPQFH